MNPTAVLAIVALVALATALGLIWKGTTGRLHRTAASGSRIVRLPEIPRDGSVTLLQFSTAVCAPCVPTRALLADLAQETRGVQHVDIDLTTRPDLADRFGILQTPTTLILDRDGAITARIGGAPRRDAVHAELARLLA